MCTKLPQRLLVLLRRVAGHQPQENDRTKGSDTTSPLPPIEMSEAMPVPEPLKQAIGRPEREVCVQNQGSFAQESNKLKITNLELVAPWSMESPHTRYAGRRWVHVSGPDRSGLRLVVPHPKTASQPHVLTGQVHVTIIYSCALAAHNPDLAWYTDKDEQAPTRRIGSGLLRQIRSDDQQQTIEQHMFCVRHALPLHHSTLHIYLGQIAHPHLVDKVFVKLYLSLVSYQELLAEV